MSIQIHRSHNGPEIQAREGGFIRNFEPGATISDPFETVTPLTNMTRIDANDSECLRQHLTLYTLTNGSVDPFGAH